MTLDALSKSDFRGLGCEDVSGPQLRARVFVLEGLAAELALTLEECRPLVASLITSSAYQEYPYYKPTLSRIDEALTSARKLLPARKQGPPPAGLCDECRAAWITGEVRTCDRCKGAAQCVPACPCVEARREADEVPR